MSVIEKPGLTRFLLSWNKICASRSLFNTTFKFEPGDSFLSTPTRELPIPTLETLKFVDGYDLPSANVVLVSSDTKGLRIHDYHLKSARYVSAVAFLSILDS